MTRLRLANGGHVLVDDDVVDFLSQWTWWRDSKGYAVRRERRRAILMHVVIMGEVPPGLEVDHQSGDRLDNRRENLRLATALDNGANRVKPARSKSPFKGVRKWRRCYVARIGRSRLQLHLGSFRSAHEAAFAYDVAAPLVFGEFARLNLGWTHAEAAAQLGVNAEAIRTLVTTVEARVRRFLAARGAAAAGAATVIEGQSRDGTAPHPLVEPASPPPSKRTDYRRPRKDIPAYHSRRVEGGAGRTRSRRGTQG